MTGFLDRLFNHHKLVRRSILAWAVWLITCVVLRVTEPDVFTAINAAGATVVTAVIGLLTAAIGFYQWSRGHDDRRNNPN